jgi:hypothetical protein
MSERGRGRGRGRGNHGNNGTNGATTPTTAGGAGGGAGGSPAPSLNGHTRGAAPTNNHVNGSNGSNGSPNGNGNGNGNNHHNGPSSRSPQMGGGRGWRVPPSGLGLSPPPNGPIGGPSSPNLGPSGSSSSSSGLPAGISAAQMAQFAAAAAYNQNVGMQLPMPLSMYPGMTWPPTASPYFTQNHHHAAAAAAAAQYMPSPFYNPYGNTFLFPSFLSYMQF